MLDLLRVAAGFLIQIVPCAFYCLYPFRDRFRFPRRRVLLLLCSVIVLADALFTGIYAVQRKTTLATELIFYGTIAVLLLVYALCIRAGADGKLFVFFLMMNYGFCISETVNRLCTLMPELMGDAPGILYAPGGLVAHVALNLLLLKPMLALTERTRMVFLDGLPGGARKQLVAIPAAFVLISSLFYRIPDIAGLSDRVVLHLFVSAMEIFMIVLYSWILRLTEQAQLRERERTRLELAVKAYQTSETNAEQLREIRHEIMHHLDALAILMQERDYAGAEAYLGKVSGVAANLPAVQYTPHRLTNAILTDYRARRAHRHAAQLSDSAAKPAADRRRRPVPAAV